MKFQIEQIAPDLTLTWALTERFRWSQKVNNVLKRDTDGKLLVAAYDAVGWEKYYERLKGTPFYNWGVEGGGILTLGGNRRRERKKFLKQIEMRKDNAGHPGFFSPVVPHISCAHSETPGPFTVLPAAGGLWPGV